MKKWTVFGLALALAALVAAPAAAVRADPYSQMALDAGLETYYIGEGNRIHSTGGFALVDVPARSLVYADGVKLVFTAVDERNRHDLAEPGLLYSVALTGNEPEAHLIASVATDCVYIPQDGAVYYVDQGDLNTLMAYEVLRGTATAALDCGGEIQQLRRSIDGLVVDRDAGDELYVPQLGRLEVANVPEADTTIQVSGHFATRLGADGVLQLRSQGQKAGQLTQVDRDVLAATVLGGKVFYLKTAGDETALMEYNYAAGEGIAIDKFKSRVAPEMAAAGEFVYLLAADGRIYQMNAASHALVRFDHVPGGVNTPVLWATDDRLLLYDAGTLDGMLRFVQAYPLYPGDEADDGPAPTRAPVNTPQPDPEPFVLTKGSRGDAVRELQNLLIDHNYPIRTADGIYGGATLDAVKYLQYDMGVAETGSVTEAFLSRLKRDMPDYERFVPMSRGDNGIRVYDLQVKLKALGWTDAAANGNFGPKTEAAVKAFQEEIGHRATGVADVKTEKYLWSKDAPSPSPAEVAPPPPTKRPTPDNGRDPSVSESDLTFLRDWMNSRFVGANYDKHGAVYKLQTKLAQMGYLKKSQRSKVYDTKTLLAVKKYQIDGDFMAHATGLPNDQTLMLLFPTDVEHSTMND